MDFNEYQERAIKTDTTRRGNIALYGLAGEVGSLFTTFKKRFRDKQKTEIFKGSLIEELGDVLWYLSAIAKQNDIKLADVADFNLSKIEQFYGDNIAPSFDARFPDEERFPDKFEVHFLRNPETGRVELYYEGSQLGDSLSDNVFEKDDYKFHDVFHLAFLTHLHWSPVFRKLLGKKRRSDSQIDENEDGARAAIVEEAVSAIIFQYAVDSDFFELPELIPHSLITLIQRMTSKFEVSAVSTSNWRNAIYDGCRIFVDIKASDGGVVMIDLDKSTMRFHS